MALTPGNLDAMVTIGTAVEVETPASQPSRTYAVNWQTGRVSGTVDGMDALKQAIYKVLQTERFAYLIYSWNYGFEANRLIGQSAAFLRSEIQRLVTEALLAMTGSRRWKTSKSASQESGRRRWSSPSSLCLERQKLKRR